MYFVNFVGQQKSPMFSITFTGSGEIFRGFFPYTVNNYRQVTGMVTGENFAFFIYRHFVEIL